MLLGSKVTYISSLLNLWAFPSSSNTISAGENDMTNELYESGHTHKSIVWLHRFPFTIHWCIWVSRLYFWSLLLNCQIRCLSVSHHGKEMEQLDPTLRQTVPKGQVGSLWWHWMQWYWEGVSMSERKNSDRHTEWNVCPKCLGSSKHILCSGNDTL